MPYYGDGAPYYYGSPFSNHSSLMSNVGRYYSPIAARYSPHLSTISESPSFSHRRRHGPASGSSTSSSSSSSGFGRPRRIIDTADIDVSKPPRSYGQDSQQQQQRHRLRRDRPTIKIRSQALKDNPALREYNEKHEKTVGELLVEKFLIKDKQQQQQQQPERKMRLYHQAALLRPDAPDELISKEEDEDLLAAMRRRVTRRMTRRRSSADVLPLNAEQIEREAALLAAQAEALDSLVAEEQAEIEVEVRRGTFAKRQAMRLPVELSELSGSEDEEPAEPAARRLEKPRKRRRRSSDSKPRESEAEEDEVLLEIPEEEFEWDDREKCDDLREIVPGRDEVVIKINDVVAAKGRAKPAGERAGERDGERDGEPRVVVTNGDAAGDRKGAPSGEAGETRRQPAKVQRKLSLDIIDAKILETQKEIKDLIHKEKRFPELKRREKMLKLDEATDREDKTKLSGSKPHASRDDAKEAAKVEEKKVADTAGKGEKPRSEQKGAPAKAEEAREEEETMSKERKVPKAKDKSDKAKAVKADKSIKRTKSAPQTETEEDDLVPRFKIEACNSVGDFSTLFVKAAAPEPAKRVEHHRESVRLPAPRARKSEADSSIETEVVLPVRKPYVLDTTRNSVYLALKPSQPVVSEERRGFGGGEGRSAVIDETRKESDGAELTGPRPAKCGDRSKIESDALISRKGEAHAASDNVAVEPAKSSLPPARPEIAVSPSDAKAKSAALAAREEFVAWWDEPSDAEDKSAKRKADDAVTKKATADSGRAEPEKKTLDAADKSKRKAETKAAPAADDRVKSKVQASPEADKKAGAAKATNLVDKPKKTEELGDKQAKPVNSEIKEKAVGDKKEKDLKSVLEKEVKVEERPKKLEAASRAREKSKSPAKEIVAPEQVTKEVQEKPVNKVAETKAESKEKPADKIAETKEKPADKKVEPKPEVKEKPGDKIAETKEKPADKKVEPKAEIKEKPGDKIVETKEKPVDKKVEPKPEVKEKPADKIVEAKKEAKEKPADKVVDVKSEIEEKVNDKKIETKEKAPSVPEIKVETKEKSSDKKEKAPKQAKAEEKAKPTDAPKKQAPSAPKVSSEKEKPRKDGKSLSSPAANRSDKKPRSESPRLFDRPLADIPEESQVSSPTESKCPPGVTPAPAAKPKTNDTSEPKSSRAPLAKEKPGKRPEPSAAPVSPAAGPGKRDAKDDRRKKLDAAAIMKIEKQILEDSDSPRQIRSSAIPESRDIGELIMQPEAKVGLLLAAKRQQQQPGVSDSGAAPEGTTEIDFWSEIGAPESGQPASGEPQSRLASPPDHLEPAGAPRRSLRLDLSRPPADEREDAATPLAAEQPGESTPVISRPATPAPENLSHVPAANLQAACNGGAERTGTVKKISKWSNRDNLSQLLDLDADATPLASKEPSPRVSGASSTAKKRVVKKKKSVSSAKSSEKGTKKGTKKKTPATSPQTSTLKTPMSAAGSPRNSPSQRPADLNKLFYTTPAILLTATPRDLRKVRRAKVKRKKPSTRTPSLSSDSTGSTRSTANTSTEEGSNCEEDAEQKRLASTRSNDSGFDGSPRLSTPSQSSENQRNADSDHYHHSGRITPPATNLPRFKKYEVTDFNFLKVLGKGSFGKVLLAELRGTECVYAVKCLKKDVVLEDDDVECTLIERKVLTLATRHPYLCHLFCTFQTESHLFFVMEYLNGGDLMFHIQKSGRFSEARARFYAAEIWSGLIFLHKKGIVYRDLKLDNVLLDFEGHIRIADFGMCKLQIFLDRTADTFCGTPDYMAPEIIKGLKYNQAVDWWSFGVLLYEMLTGQSPFSGCDEDELFWSICNERPFIPRYLCQSATELLVALLEKDSGKRIPGHEISCHSFFSSITWEKLERRTLEPPFKPAVEHTLDTRYFDTAFTTERPRLTVVPEQILTSMDQSVFRGFSYTNPNATD